MASSASAGLDVSLAIRSVVQIVQDRVECHLYILQALPS